MRGLRDGAAVKLHQVELDSKDSSSLRELLISLISHSYMLPGSGTVCTLHNHNVQYSQCPDCIK